MICTKWIQRCEEFINLLCTHWWGFHPIGLHLKNVSKSSHRLFIVGAYIWNLVYFIRIIENDVLWTCWLSESSFVKESWCQVWLSLKFEYYSVFRWTQLKFHNFWFICIDIVIFLVHMLRAQVMTYIPSFHVPKLFPSQYFDMLEDPHFHVKIKNI